MTQWQQGATVLGRKGLLAGISDLSYPHERRLRRPAIELVRVGAGDKCKVRVLDQVVKKNDEFAHDSG